MFVNAPLLTPIELITDWVSNYDFYCCLPSLSKSHQGLMHNDDLHRQQCKQRLSMTDFQFQLFKEVRFPLLYIPLSNISTVANARKKLLWHEATNSDVSVLPAKSWWLECTRLFLHLSYATRELTWHAPHYLSHPDGNSAQIKYELPPLVKSILIDELTSFYVFNLLRRYQADEYHHTVMFDDITYDESALQKYKDHIKRDRKCWEDYSVLNEAEEFDEYAPFWNDVSRFSEKTQDRLKFLLGEAFYLGHSPAHGCGAYEFSHYLWFGPSLKTASDQLSILPHCPSTFIVDMEDAVPMVWDMKNGDDGPPQASSDDLRTWMLDGGMSRGLKEREWFRLEKFVTGEEGYESAVKSVRLAAASKDQLKDAQYQPAAVKTAGDLFSVLSTEYYFHTSYKHIAAQIEHSSHWWAGEQEMFTKLLSKLEKNAPESTNSDDDSDDGSNDDEAVGGLQKSRYQELVLVFDKYLHHVFRQASPITTA